MDDCMGIPIKKEMVGVIWIDWVMAEITGGT
jgi:hypothetical protein